MSRRCRTTVAVRPRSAAFSSPHECSPPSTNPYRTFSKHRARHTGPVCRLCRREGLKLFLKGSRCDTPKCAIERRGTPPGMQQARRGKQTDYGQHLREKQKVKHYYGVLERQFRHYFGQAERSRGNTGETLMSLLER